MTIYQHLLEQSLQGRKMLTVLIDPDKLKNKEVESIAVKAALSGVDYFFVGGSRTWKITQSHHNRVCQY